MQLQSSARTESLLIFPFGKNLDLEKWLIEITDAILNINLTTVFRLRFTAEDSILFIYFLMSKNLDILKDVSVTYKAIRLVFASYGHNA